MAGFLSQLRSLTLGTAHDLLNKTIDLNSPTVVRQNLRDIEDALGKLNSDAAVSEGQLRTLKRELGDLSQKVITDKATLAKLLESKDPTAVTLARTKAALVIEEQRQVGAKTADIDVQESAAAKMQNAVTQLQGRHDMLASRVRELENLDRDSKSREAAARALNSAAALMNTGTSSSIDNIETRMRERNDIAAAKFDQAIGSMPAEDHSEEIDALLASLAPVAK